MTLRMPSLVPFVPKHRIAVEAEIRCYRLPSEALSYEVFVLFDDGESRASGHIDSWEEAVKQAQSWTDSKDGLRMFAAHQRTGHEH